MNLCIASPSLRPTPQTFVQAHIEHLPAEVTYLYGGEFPVYIHPGHLLLPIFHPSVNSVLAAGMGKNLEFMNRFLMDKVPDAARVWALRRLFRRRGIQAMLAEFGPSGVALMDACESARVPLIVHFHGYDAFDQRTIARVGPRYPELFRIARRIVVVGEEMRERLLSLGAPAEKVVLNPCGVDTAQFTSGDPSSAAPTFVAVGRLVPIKAPQITLLAFAKVVAVCPEARLVLVGDGPLRDSLEQMQRALGLESSLELAGELPPPEVHAKLMGARAFVQHCMKTASVEAEGFGLTLVEAGATGLPVVASRCGGMQDIVRHGETGYLVKQGDIDEMAEYMIRLARDPRLAAQLGAAGRVRVEERFSLDRSIRELWRIIQESV